MSKVGATTVVVPIFDRMVTVVVARRPVTRLVKDKFLRAYEGAGLKAFGPADWNIYRTTDFEDSAGICLTNGPLGPRIIVWVSGFRMGILVHELSHATEFILSSTGVGDNDEARARLMEYLAKEAVNGLRGQGLD